MKNTNKCIIARWSQICFQNVSNSEWLCLIVYLLMCFGVLILQLLREANRFRTLFGIVGDYSSSRLHSKEMTLLRSVKTSTTNRQNQSELKKSKNSGRSRPPRFAKILKSIRSVLSKINQNLIKTEESYNISLWCVQHLRKKTPS